MKNYFVFSPKTRSSRETSSSSRSSPCTRTLIATWATFDRPRFLDFLESWLDVDYALLIQQDPTGAKKQPICSNPFSREKSTGPYADAAEDLARWLRYIQTHLYEMGDPEGRYLQRKLFEYYGCMSNVGGRRTGSPYRRPAHEEVGFSSPPCSVSSSESRSHDHSTRKGGLSQILPHSTHGQNRFLPWQTPRASLNRRASRRPISTLPARGTSGSLKPCTVTPLTQNHRKTER